MQECPSTERAKKGPQGFQGMKAQNLSDDARRILGVGDLGDEAGDIRRSGEAISDEAEGITDRKEPLKGLKVD